MVPSPCRRSLLGLLALLTVCLVSAIAGAYAGNIGASTDGTPGYVTSQVFGAGSMGDGFPADDNGGCPGCHGQTGPGPSNIALNGTVLALSGTPTTFTVAQGSLTTFTLTWTNTVVIVPPVLPPAKLGGGFLVMHNDTSSNDDNGVLDKVSMDPAVHTCKGAMTGAGSTTCNATLNNNTEVMHEVPENNDASNNVTFQFTYLANGKNVCQTFEFGLWVNSENRDNLCFNALDYPVLVSFRITTTCNDSNGCTNDSCNGTSCGHINNTSACSDLNPCTTGDTCSGGSCVSGGPTNCNDGDTCTTDSCSIFLGCQHVNNTASCSDGSACTTGDTCSGGSCVGGAAPNCNDGNGCTTDSCNPGSGCVHTNNAASCDDGSACTSGDVCSGGACSGSTVSCDDSNSCTTDGCNPGTGCTHTNNTIGCDDGNACTTGDACGGGGCVSGSALNCNDGNVCTNDACNTTTGCTHTNNSAACSDGNACTTGDTCAGGGCVGGAALSCDDGNPCTTDSCNPATGCQHVNNTVSCNDGNACTDNDTCSGGTCGGTVISCSDGNGCTDDSCNPASGCVHSNNTSACSDGNACTAGDACAGGSCVGGAAPNCNDGNGCTDDSCNPASGCVHSNNTASCSDGSACTTGDTCTGGSCMGGAAPNCNDGNGCTTDACNPATGCTHANNTVACSDGDACTTGDTCSGGACVPGASTVCNDGEACTTDSCNPASGCVFTALTDGTACGVDGNICTFDVCKTGKCHAPVPAGATICRVAVCSGVDPNASAINQEFCNGTATCPGPNVTTCGAGVPCNGSTTACQGACGQDTDCPSTFFCDLSTNTCKTVLGMGGQCTRDSMCGSGRPCVDGRCCNSACGGNNPNDCQQCSAAGVCTSLNAVACSDGSACTSGDVCSTGTCVPGAAPNCDDGNRCTDDSCNTTTGCVHTNNTSSCSDGNACTTGDSCGGGACVGGAAPSCDDGNPCTTDSCSVATGCVHTNNTLACSDGSACTTGDVCSGGVCVGGAAPNCNDNNPCTNDSCAPATGCVHGNNTIACTDGNACTQGDTCLGGACVGGAIISCDDGNPCTDDACNTATGCGHVNNAASCSDGNACTTADKCAAGVCVGGPAPNCADVNPCTDDSCNPASGCVHANNTLSCTDNDACTTNDRCAGGACVGGPAPNCDDGEFCTADTCDKNLGCVSTPSNAGVVCRGANGVCDKSESCDGASPNCPKDSFATGVPCRAATCTNGAQTLASSCNGAGTACPPPVTASCGAFTCGASACRTTCTTDTDCVQGDYCASNQCVPKGAPGAPCAATNECLSNFCADGVCCNADCTGQCEACNLAGHPGTCSPVVGVPLGLRPVCVGDHTGCDGTCNGINTQACTMPSSSAQCRAPLCTSGTATLQEFCDGSGSCPVKREQACVPRVCGATQCQGCVSDGQCGAGNFCRAGVCAPEESLGTTCSRDGECGSGHCVDGNCCDSDCTGQCQACKVTGKEGTCVGVDGPPVGGRPACNSDLSTCGGSCKKESPFACTYAGAGVVCRAPECKNSRATLVAFCSGAGTCPPPEQADCPSGCGDTLCKNGCTADAECNGGDFCAGGVCQRQKGNGGRCGAASECASSYCVDGVCCDQPCSGQCEACDVPTSSGSCTPVVGGPHGSRMGCANEDAVCAGQCDGIHPAVCEYPGSSTACRAASCASGVATLAESCEGNGSCGPLEVQDCGAVACNPARTLCAGGCTKDADCQASNFCSGGVCVAKLANGTSCGSASECANGSCVDGVCCESACGGQCQSCNQASSPGKCVIVTGPPRGGRAACPGVGTCGGACDGLNAVACALPGRKVTCGVGVCSNGFVSNAPNCNGAGLCVPEATGAVPCYPYSCDPNSALCLTGCGADTDCAPGALCAGGACEQPLAEGGTGSGGAAPDASVSAGGTGGGPDAGAGGKLGTAGSLGTGDASGSGGGPASSGGRAPIGGERDAGATPRRDAGIIDSKDTGSCGCRLGGASRDESGRAGLVLAALGLLAARRRRRDLAA